MADTPLLLCPPSCLTGYVNHSLSLFYTKDFQDPDGTEDPADVTECRFGPHPPLLP